MLEEHGDIQCDPSQGCTPGSSSSGSPSPWLSELLLAPAHPLPSLKAGFNPAWHTGSVQALWHPWDQDMCLEVLCALLPITETPPQPC